MVKKMIPKRVLAKITVSAANECWMWTGYSNGVGYGRTRMNGVDHYVHRLVYEDRYGPASRGLQLDHLCRIRACCNPDHLEPVTQQENILRGNGASARNARKTHCPEGHPYSPENTLRRANGDRRCRTCKQAEDRRQGRSA